MHNVSYKTKSNFNGNELSNPTFQTFNINFYAYITVCMYAKFFQANSPFMAQINISITF